MADDERHAPDEEDPSLELPSLRSAFRRRKGRVGPEPVVPAVAECVPEAGLEPEPGPELQDLDPSILPVAMSEAPVADGKRRRGRDRTPFRLHLPGPVVAVVTGAIVGLALVGVTVASLHACRSMRGTSSCGKAGILLLLAITVAMVFLGSLLLRIAGVTAPGSTSFLGVGLLVVLILLALLPVLDDWWVVIAVPALAMVTYVAAWWLTTTYSEPGERAP